MDKATLRDDCLRRLKDSARHNKRYKDAQINRQLANIIKKSGARSVLFYWPLPFEADVRGLLKAMRRECDVYLPFMEGVSFKMVPFRLPLKRKQFGIFEAGNTDRKIKKIDIVVVPAVGVDAEGRRIGFGKGMYDRFFAALDRKPIILFVQSVHCFTNQRICDHYDVAADILVTPSRCYSNTGIQTNVKRNTLRRGHCHAKRSSRFFHFKKNK